jgi:sn-glycerol 3-phosphate transport system ATP-binding protein
MATVNMIAVHKFYDKTCILEDIHIHIEKGEFVAVVGPSGCGKSTLLRLVAGLDTVSRGRILINHNCVNTIPPALRDMAMVFQNYALYPHMTAYDNMAYGLKMRGMKQQDIRQRVETVGDMLQLTGYLHRKPALLSGGQRQRVAMGRAIVRSPSVFLFDEPLSNLDAKLRTEMRYEIKKIHQQLNTTCLYVTHDQTEAMTMADRVVILNKGKVEQIGTPRDLYERPATLFVARFIGHYPMNFISAIIDADQRVISTMGLEFPCPILVPGMNHQARVMIGIRAEHVEITALSDKNRIAVSVDFVDDMGSDKLVQLITELGGERLSARISGDRVLTGSRFAIQMDMSKAHLFCQITGKRIGGWGE